MCFKVLAIIPKSPQNNPTSFKIVIDDPQTKDRTLKLVGLFGGLRVDVKRRGQGVYDLDFASEHVCFRRSLVDHFFKAKEIPTPDLWLEWNNDHSFEVKSSSAFRREEIVYRNSEFWHYKYDLGEQSENRFIGERVEDAEKLKKLLSDIGCHETEFNHFVSSIVENSTG